MALTYPLSWLQPPLVERLTFDLSRVEAVSQTRGGVVQSAERGRALWTFEAATTTLNVSEFETFRAFLSALRGRANAFYFYDVGRANPVFYPDGVTGLTRASDGTPWDGTAALTAATGYLVSLSGLPSGYRLWPGDMMSWPWGTTRTLHRIVDSRNATGGTIGNLQVEPDIPPGSVIGSVVTLIAAPALFRLADPLPEPRRRLSMGEPLTIRGVQCLV
jgi:hypothetical protein